jgi:hypothetical protein
MESARTLPTGGAAPPRAAAPAATPPRARPAAPPRRAAPRARDAAARAASGNGRDPSASASAPAAASARAAAASSLASRGMLEWMAANGAPVGAFTLAAGDVDVTVAARDLAAGELALAVPENLVVTLGAVLGAGGESSLAELLSTGKLSELAILALHLMYEKKRGAESFWAPYIRELDRQGARGAQGAVSPILWPPEQAAALLRGSPVAEQVRARLAGISKEYEELDTVWYLGECADFRVLGFLLP